MALKSLCLSCTGLSLLMLGSKLGPVVGPSKRKQSSSLWSPLSRGWTCPSWSRLTAPVKLSLFVMKASPHGRGIMVMWKELKGRAVLYSEEGHTAMLSWKREASHLPAKGEDSDPHTCFSKVPCKGRRLDLSPASRSCSRHWTAVLSFSGLKSARRVWQLLKITFLQLSGLIFPAHLLTPCETYQ